MESDFYKQGVRDAGLRGQPLALAKLVNHHEANHVRFLRSALGSNAVRKPRFDFRGTTKDNGRFLRTAFKLENEGVAAYSGQGPRILSEEYLEAAISILTIEARHAAAFALIVGNIGGKNGITPNGTFDKPKTMSRVLSDVKATHFIKG
ncbi:MAG: ferritin-like domain-containing protein [Solirubrobacteraceae bacterium]